MTKAKWDGVDQRTTVEQRHSHWSVKKEINVANIIATVLAIGSGIWWAASVETNFIIAENERTRLNDKVIANTKTGETRMVQLRNIDTKIDAVLYEVRFMQGIAKGKDNGQ